ncbi:T9SS type A sorting domain-containing protein [Winogradskyella psychrotolerans]|uniref:T9SS type A sorting domain-containing protein n=1 Tax=Winogradskyella psychrotolerans TaxID=1344585 RepID=UPI001C068931|nr:T9SS type A sorting domain-containing protein [Winogradskyella psychrotolerans]MBU2922225.1 T9SS type A sorting domain-containing protein [Winogradskyella psychrotolerans]
MRHFFTILMLLITTFCFSQSQGYTDFESETLEGWVNSDNSTTNITLEQNENNYSYLRKQCNGMNTISGEMSIRNITWFQDNYINGSGAAQINGVIKNTNSFDIYLRLGFSDFDNTKIILTDPIIIPQTDNWVVFEINTTSIDFTLIEGTNTIENVLSNIYEMRLLHNENISFDGAYETGFFEIDDIGTTYLGINDFLYNSIELYPNPAQDNISVKTENMSINKIEIFSLLGNKIKIQYHEFENINLTNIESGVYLLKIYAENGKILTKKIVKQ